jgi:hypothetical protein
VIPRQGGVSSTIIALVAITVILVAAGAVYFISSAGQHESGGGSFYFAISINYSGHWNLVIWGKNATGQQNLNFTRSLKGSGDYSITVITELAGIAEDTVCTEATKLDSQNLTLVLNVNGEVNSTVASNPSVSICQTWAV